ncbi:MAG: hypothetical protein ACOYKA_04575 [Legionellaceae bacterium]
MKKPGEKEAEETKDASLHSGPPALKSPESIARVKGILIFWRETSAQPGGRVHMRCHRLQEAAPVSTSLQVMIDYSAPSTAKKNP